MDGHLDTHNTQRTYLTDFILCLSFSGSAKVAQLVEQWTENPRVGGSSPSLGTTLSTETLVDYAYNL